MPLLDTHTHILPGIDDGAKDLAASRALLDALCAQGVSSVVLTPHFYPHRRDLESFLERRQRAVEALLDLDGMVSLPGEVGSAALAKYSDGERELKIFLGAEVALSPALEHLASFERLVIGRNRHVLIEMPFGEMWDGDTFQLLEGLMFAHRLRPIIAHIERYPATSFGRDTAPIQRLVDMGCLIQLNVSSLAEFRPRGVAKRLLAGDWIDLLGSDAHNLETRPPRFDLLLKYARKWGIDVDRAFPGDGLFG